jgi:hypothetical protein
MNRKWTVLRAKKTKKKDGTVCVRKPSSLERLREHLLSLLKEYVHAKWDFVKEPGLHGLSSFSVKPPKIEQCPYCNEPGFRHRRLKNTHHSKQFEAMVDYRMPGVVRWCHVTVGRNFELWGHHEEPKIVNTAPLPQPPKEEIQVARRDDEVPRVRPRVPVGVRPSRPQRRISRRASEAEEA